MPPFVFKLATLLKLREKARDECRQAFAAAQRAEQLGRERLAAVDRQLNDARSTMAQAASPGSVHLEQLRNAAYFRHRLLANREALQSQQAELAAAAQARYADLLAADHAVRILEKLRERHADRFRTQQHRVEIRQLDEAAARTAA